MLGSSNLRVATRRLRHTKTMKHTMESVLSHGSWSQPLVSRLAHGFRLEYYLYLNIQRHTSDPWNLHTRSLLSFRNRTFTLSTTRRALLLPLTTMPNAGYYVPPPRPPTGQQYEQQQSRQQQSGQQQYQSQPSQPSYSAPNSSQSQGNTLFVNPYAPPHHIYPRSHHITSPQTEHPRNECCDACCECCCNNFFKGQY